MNTESIEKQLRLFYLTIKAGEEITNQTIKQYSNQIVTDVLTLIPIPKTPNTKHQTPNNKC
jgi:hypothetical protein